MLLAIQYYIKLAYYLAGISLYRGHRGSYLGWSWLIVKPSIQVLIYAIIFPFIARFDQEHYPYFLISGMLAWTFLNNAIVESSYSLIHRAEVLKRSTLPSVVFPIADAMKHLILFAISLLSAFVLYAMIFGHLSNKIYLLPLAIMPLVIFVFVCSIALAYITPYLRDVGDVVGIGLNILFFFTPIIYPISALPVKMQFFLALNPIFWLIRPIQEVLYYQTMPTLKTCLISCLVAGLSAVIAYLIYKSAKRNVIYYL